MMFPYIHFVVISHITTLIGKIHFNLIFFNTILSITLKPNVNYYVKIHGSQIFAFPLKNLKIIVNKTDKLLCILLCNSHTVQIKYKQNDHDSCK